MRRGVVQHDVELILAVIEGGLADIDNDGSDLEIEKGKQLYLMMGTV